MWMIINNLNLKNFKKNIYIYNIFKEKNNKRVNPIKVLNFSN